MYLFATSLGGIISAQYLINDQNKTSIKAATFFGTPLSTADNCEFLDNSAYGFNNYIMGKNLISKFRPMFKPVNVLSSPEQRDSYQKLLSGEVQPSLNTFDDFCASPMFGYRNRYDYRKRNSVKGKLKELKIPCLFLHAWDDFILGPNILDAQLYVTIKHILQILCGLFTSLCSD